MRKLKFLRCKAEVMTGAAAAMTLVLEKQILGKSKLSLVKTTRRDLQTMRSRIRGLRSSTESGSGETLGEVVACDVLREEEGHELWESELPVLEERVIACNVFLWRSESRSSVKQVAVGNVCHRRKVI